MSIHLLSRGLLKAPAGGGGGSYTQNFVDSNGTAYLTYTNIGGNVAAATFSLWFTPHSVSGTQILWYISGRGEIKLINQTLSVTIDDNLGTTVYSSTSSGNVFSASTLYHLQITINLGTPSLEIKVNGSDVSMNTDPSTISAGNGLIDLDRTTYLFHNSGGFVLDADISDFIIDDSAISNSTLYNGGTPPDPTTAISTPLLLMGADMTADERGGNASQGWNDGYNLGTGGAMTVGSATYTDV